MKKSMKKSRLTLILTLAAIAAAVVFCVLWRRALADRSELTDLARSGAAEVCTRFSDYQSRGDDGDYWGGVAAFHTFQQACALLTEDGADDRAVCSAVYGVLLLSPDRARACLPEIIDALEPLAQDPTDQTARLRLYELRSLLENPE